MQSVALLFCLLATVSRAAIFHWAGNTMNFAEPNNWEAGSVPYNSSELDLTSDARYTTTIPSGTIQTGRIIFPRNGRLRFGADKTTFKFVKDSTKDAGKFLGPRNEPGFHFGCGTNWVKRTASQAIEDATPSKYPPCTTDKVEFFDTESYYFFTASQDRAFKVEEIKYDGLSVKPNELPRDEFSQLDGALETVADENDCEYLGDNGCFCPSTCPDQDPAIAREQAAIIEGAIAAKFATEQAAREEIVTVEVVFKTAAAALNVTNWDIISERTEISIEEQDMFASVVEMLLDNDQAAVTASVVTSDNPSFALEASLNITATAKSFLPANSLPPIESPLSIELQTSAISDLQQSTLALALEIASQNLVATVLARDSFRAINLTACETASTPSTCHGLVKSGIALSAYTASGGDVWDAICPEGQCKQQGAIRADLDTLPESALHPFVQTLPVSTWDSVKLAIDQAMAMKSLTESTALANVAAAVKTILGNPSLYSGVAVKAQTVTTLLAVGKDLPSSRLYRLMNAENYGKVQQAVEQAFKAGAPGRVSDVNAILSVLQAAAGRRSAEEDVYLSINASYLIICSAGESCSVDNDVVMALVRGIVAALQLEYPLCFSSAKGWDEPCLAAEVSTWANNQTPRPSENALKSRIATFVACDERGKDLSGLCFGEDPNAKAIRARVFELLEVDSDTISKSASSKTAGSGFGMPMIAAAAGGGVLLLVIIVLLVRRGKSTPGRTEVTETREVVAFSNPLYADGQDAIGNRSGVENPLYDDNTPGEGLYDEPSAMHATTTPIAEDVYADLDDMDFDNMGSDETAGYLEAEPDDEGGYLDVGQEEELPEMSEEYFIPKDNTDE
eukprot:m.25316 g.25316  ORF g.25316 m.25316 type:complete len:851 (+) comp11586_c0_seq2:908-3460(+)